jgi:hypothetical protein
MQRLLTENTKRTGLLGSGIGMVLRNKRYILWFYVLNLALAVFGTGAFTIHAHEILGQSLYSDRLVHGFHVVALVEMFLRPEFGPIAASRLPALCFALLFLFATALFLPGIVQGLAATYRLPRDDFFRACGRNLWRFVRLIMVAGLVMGVMAGALFGLRSVLVEKAGDSTNELLPFCVSMTCLVIIFLAMTTVRIWFDLAEVDVVLSDQRAMRRSIAAAFRHTFRNLGRLLASYVAITIVAAIILVGGLLGWIRFVPPDNILRAFLFGQLTLLLLLIPRFWQRGVAVAYWEQNMLAPVVAVEPIEPEPMPAPVVVEPMPSPVIPSAPPTPQES